MTRPGGGIAAAAGLRLLALAALLVVWEAVSRAGLIPPLILPPPSAIFAAALKDGGLFLASLQVTVLEIVVATAIAWIIGVPLGILIGSSRRATAVLAPLLDSAFAVPWVVLYPVALAWLGIGSPSKVAFAAAYGVLPILLTTIAAVASVEPWYYTLAAALGATRFQLMTKILLPRMLPAILSGLRVGTGLVVIGVIVGEMLASVGGLGFQISSYRTLLESGHVYLGVLLALLLAWLVNAGLGQVEQRTRYQRAHD
ncbi:MAG TPA: ABC transporter permease subunit [Chloroflexota bacterium]|jgi:NitT/TauT family transport system permease protein/taurine transport system permease protein